MSVDAGNSPDQPSVMQFVAAIVGVGKPFQLIEGDQLRCRGAQVKLLPRLYPDILEADLGCSDLE